MSEALPQQALGKPPWSPLPGSARASAVMSLARRNWDIVLLLALAGAVYQPWDSPHLPLTDFGLVFAARGSSGSLFSQYAGVAAYYMAEGRLCLITYLYLALGAAGFGTWAPGWHWLYFALNAIVLLLARSLFIRIGINRTAAFATLALWALMGPTAELWIRPAGEQIGLILFLIALHCALNFAEAPDWRRRAMIIAACAVGIAFSKELLLVLLPSGWLVSRLVVRHGEWRWARWSERDTYLLTLVAACVVLAMAPIVYVLMNASSASYAAQYSAEASNLASLLRRLEAMLVPSVPRLNLLAKVGNDPAWIITRILPNLLWIGMIVLAAATGRRRIAWPLAVGVTWLAAGVLVYLPWPSQGMFYMMPFALGTMFFASHALDAPLARGSANRRVALAVSVLLILVAAVEARSTLYQHRLRAELNGGVMDAIDSQGGADVLIAAVPAPLPGTGGWASHLRGFGSAASGMRVGSWSDMSCADAKRELDTKPGVVVVSSAGGCGPMSEASLVVSGSVPRFMWPIVWRQARSEGRMYVTRSATNRRLSDSNRL